MKITLSICLLWICLLSAQAEEGEDVRSLVQYFGVTEVRKVIALHYETMDQSVEPKEIVLLDKKGDTGKVIELLGALSSKGSTFKSWPPDIPTTQVIILHDDHKYCTMAIDNGRLRRPDGGGYGRGDHEQVKSLVDILSKIRPDK